MVTFLFLLALFDSAVIAAFVVGLFKVFMGETPRSRLFQLLGGIGAFILYSCLTLSKIAEFCESTGDFSPVGMIVSLAIPLILLAINYITGGNDGNNNT